MEQGVLGWLLGSDPSIRWQVMADLTHEPDAVVAAERARVRTEGWGARLLQLQTSQGAWSSVASPRAFIETPDGSTSYALALLQDMGLDPSSDQAREAVNLVKDHVTYIFQGNTPYFGGETEPCINGRVLRIGVYFGEASEELVERLISEQLDDGGWNCEAPQSRRSSFHSTICVLEGLLEYEGANGSDVELSGVRGRGEEYLLQRGLFRSLATGEVINPDWARFSFPTEWNYDVLRGLDYLRIAGVEPDERIAEAVGLVEENRDEDGRWPLHNTADLEARRGFFAEQGFDMGERGGEPSRWNTLRALRVLDWAKDG